MRKFAKLKETKFAPSNLHKALVVENLIVNLP